MVDQTALANLVRRVQQLQNDISQATHGSAEIDARPYCSIFRQLLAEADAITDKPSPLAKELENDEGVGLLTVMALKPYVGQLLQWLKDQPGYKSNEPLVRFV